MTVADAMRVDLTEKRACLQSQLQGAHKELKRPLGKYWLQDKHGEMKGMFKKNEIM